MSDRIELTAQEIVLAADVFQSARRAMRNPDAALKAAITAVNQLRAGDPIGTIRRSSTGNIITLTEAGWVWVSRDGDHAATAAMGDLGTWPIIYTPEWL